MKADLYEHVKATPALSSLLGGQARPRFFYGVADPELVEAADAAGDPYAIASVIADPSHPHMTGVAALRNPTVHIDLWGTDLERVDALGEAFRLELDGMTGLLGTGTQLRRVFLTGDADDVVNPADGGRRVKFRRRMEFEVWYASA